jgi:hypothetical protein
MCMGMSCYVAWRIHSGVVPAEPLFRVFEALAVVLILFWLATDPALPPAERPTFDRWMLIGIVFPFLAAYQMYRAHRWAGLLMILGLLFLLAAPRITLALFVPVS